MAHTTEINVNGVITPVVEFDHSAQEIDDAVNAAHAGLVHSKYVFSSSNGSDEAIDDVLATEYNSMADKTSRLIVIENNKAGLTLPRSTFFVRIDRTDAGYGALTAISYASDVTNTLTRSIHGGRWYPWSWENPYMHLGVEYRTTERYLGKPVYVQMRESGSLAIGTSSSPANTYIEGFSGRVETVVRDELYIVPINNVGYQYKNILVDDSGKILCSTRTYLPAQTNPADAWTFCIYRCFADMSAYKGRACIWYTKNTD